jgi:macrolide transport system ATP-binding/permease protein
MNWLHQIVFRLRATFGKRHRDRTLDEELQTHLALLVEQNIERGMSPEAARRAAKLSLGGSDQIKESVRDHRGLPWLDTFAQDVRFAFRILRKSPGFTAVAVLTLALGIGASVAIFGFVDGALLEQLPYANPDRLMSVSESNIESPQWPLSYPDFLDWQRLNQSFSSLDIYNDAGDLLRTDSGAEPVQVERVSGSFFRTLGVHPMLGRDFNPGEDRLGGPNVVLLSYGAWLHRFGGRRNVIGETVELDNQAYSIIGVLPRSFSFAPSGNAEFWVPINTLSRHEHSRTFYAFMGIGRLRDGVSPRAAQAEMTAIAGKLQRQYAITGRSLSASVVPLSEIFVGDVRPILLTLLAGAQLLLVIAGINITSLLLVRSEGRKHEIAVRRALGATPRRLVRQFVIEALLLASLSSAFGVIVASGFMKLLIGLVPADMASGMPFLAGVDFNSNTGTFAAVIALLVTLLLTTTPALRLLQQRIHDGLGRGGERGASGQTWRKLGANLVIVELAVAVILLAGAGLLGRSLYRLLRVPLGFDPNHLATVQVIAPEKIYQTDQQAMALYSELIRRVSNLPGVESAGFTSLLPVECNCMMDSIQVQGRPHNGEHHEVDERHVSPAYLPTLKARLVRGRDFTEADDASAPGVAIINQTLAHRYFPGQDPIGQRITDDEGGRPSVWEVIGVVDDVHEAPLDVGTWPAEYFPIAQTHDRSFTLVVRTQQDAGMLLSVLVGTLHQIDPRLGVSDEATMNAKIDGTEAALLHRFSAWLVGGFAAMALILGVIGLYGVMAYSVSQRTREFAVRMALGAPRASVYRLVMGQAGRLIAAGLGIGLLCSMGTSMLIRNLFFGVQAWDAATLGGVALLLTLASVAACYIPARRATRVDPMVGLRYE